MHTRIFSRWQFRERPEAVSAYPHPMLILLGHQDATAGYTSQWQLLEHYPRATLAVLDRAGHALLHEQPELARQLNLSVVRINDVGTRRR